VLTPDSEAGIQRQLWCRSKKKKEKQLLGSGEEGLGMYGRAWSGVMSGSQG